MQEISKSQKARVAIRTFKTIADALILQGMYKPSGKAGENLSEALKGLSPEIYGTMGDPRITELKGLEYVIDRMPKGIEKCSRLILTAQEDFHGTSFQKIIPLKRRRVSYAVSDHEMCFVITRGLSEIYDILTHITFLNIEAFKVYSQICNKGVRTTPEFKELERIVLSDVSPEGGELDQALWNLSIILGRTYKETRETYEYLQKSHVEHGANSGLFEIIYTLGKRVMDEQEGEEVDRLFHSITQELIGQHTYATIWAQNLKEKIIELALHERPIHVISANMHSFRNTLYGAGSLKASGHDVPADIYKMVREVRENENGIMEYASRYGLYYLKDTTGCSIDVHIIDTAKIDIATVHEDVHLNTHLIKEQQPVLVVIDYAFGTQAFEVMDELLCPCHLPDRVVQLQIESISIMGKAGILPGKKGDIMLATAHVMEGTPHNYIVNNDLSVEDFETGLNVYSGPMVTVLGTSLQNRDVLEKFHTSNWQAIGLEMEGGHYQRAINAAIIQGHITADLKTRYAYYASDNPLHSGQTLASGPMGEEGTVPTYLITKVILQKILNYTDDTSNEKTSG